MFRLNSVLVDLDSVSRHKNKMSSELMELVREADLLQRELEEIGQSSAGIKDRLESELVNEKQRSKRLSKQCHKLEREVRKMRKRIKDKYLI